MENRPPGRFSFGQNDRQSLLKLLLPLSLLLQLLALSEGELQLSLLLGLLLQLSRGSGSGALTGAEFDSAPALAELDDIIDDNMTMVARSMLPLSVVLVVLVLVVLLLAGAARETGVEAEVRLDRISRRASCRRCCSSSHSCSSCRRWRSRSREIFQIAKTARVEKPNTIAAMISSSMISPGGLGLVA